MAVDLVRDLDAVVPEPAGDVPEGNGVAAGQPDRQEARTNGPASGTCIITDSSAVPWLSHVPGGRSWPGPSRTGCGSRKRTWRS
jgi:hypothetical protein